MKTSFLKNRISMGIMGIVIASLVLGGCKKDEAPVQQQAQPDQQAQEADIVKSLQAFDKEIEYFDSGNNTDLKSFRFDFRRVTFFTLVKALQVTGLTKTVATEKLTVFAPSDYAFAQLGLNPSNIASVPNLKEILLYHVVGGRVYSRDLKAGFVPTANGAAVQVSFKNGKAFINNAGVVLADLRAFNGVIHIVNAVLLPPTQNLVQIASANPDFSILVQAVVKAGLADVLSNPGAYTVFAPTNDAFVSLLGELGATSLDDIDAATLKAVLLYHVVSGRVYSSDLKSGPVTSLGGTFNVDLGTLMITDSKGRKSGLVADKLNIQGTNGVIHVINKVILP
jgi:uncharacterized surface protein with fasciclin (FAS1) repeats